MFFKGFSFFLGEEVERKKRVEERVFLPFSNVHFAKFFLVFFFSIFFEKFLFSHKFFFQRVLSFKPTWSKFVFYLIFVVFLPFATEIFCYKQTDTFLQKNFSFQRFFQKKKVFLQRFFLKRFF